MFDLAGIGIFLMSRIHSYGTLTLEMNEKIAGHLLARILVIPIGREDFLGSGD